MSEIENKIALFCEVDFAIAFSSVYAAMMAVSSAIGLSEKDRLFLSPFTAPEVVAAPLQAKGLPVFIDIDQATGSFDLHLLGMNLKKPKLYVRDVIIAPHFSGIPLDMGALDREVQDPETVVIEDGSSALGKLDAEGKPIGGCRYSLCTLFALEESGAALVTTNSSGLAKKLRLFRSGRSDESSCFLAISCDLTALQMQAVVKEFDTVQKGGASHKRAMEPLYNHPYFVARCGHIGKYFPQAEALCQQAATLPVAEG